MSVIHPQIADWLGVPKPPSERHLLDKVENQLPTTWIQKLVSLGFERSELDSLVIPTRTLQHRRSRHKKLTMEESDRVLRLARVLSQAEAVYGSRERALNWLRRPHDRLGNRSPLPLLKTDIGSRMVEELLVQIDEGMFV